jgi:hypothetical protein
LGKIRDVSTTGIALILKRPFERGTLLFIDLSTNPNRTTTSPDSAPRNHGSLHSITPLRGQLS